MPIDFSKLTMMIGPRFKRIRSEQFDRERLARLKHARGKRTKPKNHATNKERSHLQRAKAAEHKKAAAARLEAIHAFKARVRAYWSGEAEEHP